jgi:undecaprenyl pyrophosphate phosphatase UppP
VVLTSLSHPQSKVGEEEKHPALRVVLLIWKVLVVVQVLAVVGVTAYTMVTSTRSNETALGLLVILGGFLVALIQWALAEIVEVLMDIEENTRRVAERA